MKEKKEQENLEQKELNLDELEEVCGGRGLEDVYVTKTEDISDSVKDRI